MSIESLISLLLGVPIGLISGLYTGLIVARYSRFAELRNETLRIIRRIEFMEEGPSVHITNDEELPKLHLIAGDLLFLGHKKAGEYVLELSGEMRKANHAARNGALDYATYSKTYERWQAKARALPGGKKVLLSFWGRL